MFEYLTDRDDFILIRLDLIRQALSSIRQNGRDAYLLSRSQMKCLNPSTIAALNQNIFASTLYVAA